MGFIFCPECGTQCNEQDIICRNCGYGLRCRECGAPIYPGVAACSQCGCPTAAVQSAPQQYAPPRPAAVPRPTSDDTVLRVITLLISFFLAATPFIKLFSFAFDGWDLSVVGFVIKASEIKNAISKLNIKFKEDQTLSVAIGITMIIAGIVLLIAYVSLISSIIDIGSDDPNKKIRFWKRISDAVLGFLIFTVVIWFFLVVFANNYINSKLSSISLVEVRAFKIKPFYYIIQSVGLILYILSRVRYDQCRRRFINNTGMGPTQFR